mgnify:CR=1 FL=1
MSGIFGVVTRKKDCAEILFYGTDYHSHLGTGYGGMAVAGDDFVRHIHNISQTQFKSKFFEDYRHMHGNKGIGVISALDEQPVFLRSQFGPFCIVTNGFIENADELACGLMKKGLSFSETTRGALNTTELVAKLITQGKTLVDGIENMFERIRGSCSLLLLNKDGVYAARDRFGYTPLVLGKSAGAWAVTTETAAFVNNGFETARYLQAGEIVLLNERGVVQKRRGVPLRQICTFLWIYTGFPASSYEGINTEMVRENCGRALARRDRDIVADLVCGVPDSGIGHALGYAMESGVPYRRPLVKYTAGYGRSYIPPSQETRDLVAKMKLVPAREMIKDKRIVVCEDSIVRGTQLKNFTIKKLWDNGARQIHVRPACPPLMFPCRFNFSTRKPSELVARRAIRSLEGRDIQDVKKYIDPDSPHYRRMVDWIARDLGVTTLRYQRVDDMVEAVGLPRKCLCLYCWTGECPDANKKVRRKRGGRK